MIILIMYNNQQFTWKYHRFKHFFANIHTIPSFAIVALAIVKLSMTFHHFAAGVNRSRNAVRLKYQAILRD